MGRGGRGKKPSRENSKTNAKLKQARTQYIRRGRIRESHSKQRTLLLEEIKRIIKATTDSIDNYVVVTTLSSYQREHLKAVVKEVKWVKSDTGFEWIETGYTGCDYSEEKNGLVVAKISCLSLMPDKLKILYTGLGSKTTKESDGSIQNGPISTDLFFVICCWLHNDTVHGERSVFNESFLTEIASACKPNIHNNAKHFRSYGMCFGFGSRGGFDPIDKRTLSSFGKYVVKDSSTCNELKQKVSNLMEAWTTTAIEESIQRINRYLFGNIVRDGSLIIEAAESLCHETSSLLKEKITLLGKTSYTSLYLNINAGTRDPHQEHDATYTLISVPNQRKLWSVNKSPLAFMFHPSKNTTMRIPMTPHTDVFFNAFFMCHNQEYLPPVEDNSDYYNVSGYGNKRLVQNIQRTLFRCNALQTDSAACKNTNQSKGF